MSSAVDRPRPVDEEPGLLMAVDLPTAGSTFSRGGRLNGVGWVLSRSSVAEISVFAGEAHLGYATYGLYRPDLAGPFPQYPNADHSGFSFSASLDLPPADDVSIVFSVRTVDGENRRETVAIRIIDAPASASGPEASGSPDVWRAPLQLRVDRAVIEPGGELRVEGWAGARTPLEYVNVYAGGTRLGTAELGLPRSDIAQEWPEYPNAAIPGFSFTCTPPAPSDINVVRVEASAEGGTLREVVVPVTSGIAPAEPGADIMFHCDHISLSSSGRLVIAGWCVSPYGIREADVLFDGQMIGQADLGLTRPDVEQAFPAVARAANSGLAFVHRLEQPAVGEHLVSINIRAGNGVLRVVSLLIAAEPVQVDIDTLLRLEIDAPALVGGAALLPVRGSLRIEGWALARDGVASVCAFIDDLKSGEAYCGLRREDVAAAYEDWNNALRSGFGISMPGKLLGAGRHSVRVVLRDRVGRERSTAFSITVEGPLERGWPEGIRTRMPASERQLDHLILASLNQAPRFELYMPVGETEMEAARATLAALLNQEYRDWRLTILLPAAEAVEEAGRRLLSGTDPLGGAIVLRTRGERQHAGTADAGDPAVLCASLRPGDRPGVDALLEMAIETALNPKADFIYSDELRPDPVSGKPAAYFKPGWSPDLLRSSNYIGRLWVARAGLLRRAGIELDGASGLSEYEMVLRLTSAAHAIAHVPKVLCQRSSRAFDEPELERAALARAAQASGVEAEILSGCAPGIYRFKRALRNPGLVSIIIPTCGARDLIRTCIASIRSVTAYRNFEIVCIDNIPESHAETRQWIEDNADKVIRADEPFNWSKFNNIGAGAASPHAEYYLFLNDDIEVLEPDWLSALLEQGQRDEVGVTGALLLYPDRSIQHAGLHMVRPGHGRHSCRFAREDEPGSFGRALTERNVIGVTGACMLVRRSFFEALGSFDEAHSVTNNDLDFCLRALDRGRRIVYTPHSKLMHHEMASRSSMNDLYDVKSFEKAWQFEFAEGDPYYSPFLSRSDDNFGTEAEPLEVIYGACPVLRRDEVRAILALKLDHIGDFITAFPAFRRIKERFPLAKLCVLASTASLKLASLEPSIDEVIEFNFFNEKSSKGQLELSEDTLGALRRRLECERFDIAIDLRKHMETRELLRHAGAKVTAGFDVQSRFPWLDVVLEWDEDRPLFIKRQHVADDLLRLVEAVAVACESDRSMIAGAATQHWKSEGQPEVPEGSLFNKPVVCVHPASGTPLRMWPARYFAELIDLILAEYDVNVVLIGGEEDSIVAKEVFANVRTRDPVSSLAGRIPLGRLPQFLARCALFIGNNSGPQHIAAGLGVPTIGIHSGVVDAREWAPIGPAAVAIRRNMTCSPCYFATPDQCARGIACLNELRPGDILATCRKLLAIRGGACRRESVM